MHSKSLWRPVAIKNIFQKKICRFYLFSLACTQAQEIITQKQNEIIFIIYVDIYGVFDDHCTKKLWSEMPNKPAIK